ncbi:MAG: FecR domain-containing protein [Rhodothermales bacterium]|nr:FecR domain-containing protein [Rhodothermales bacterium]MBO6779086.1 FecR domain-containing protein [Rhodothermales bacterium]
MHKTHPENELNARDSALLAEFTDALRDRMEAAAGDGMLVLAALDAAGEQEAMTPEERGHLEQGRTAFDEARSLHPGLDAACDQLQEDIRLFNSMWPADLGKNRRGVRSSRRSLMRWPARIGLGASALVLAGIFYLTIMGEVQRTTVTAPVAAYEVVRLHDGTEVRLSPGASLTFAEGSDFDRLVRLNGHAWFDVAEETRRFAVETATAVTTVLGTRFGVESTAEATEVTLVSGRVAVASRTNRNAVVVLEPGERTVVTEGLPENPAPVDVSEELSWSDLLVFRESSMQQVVDVLEARRGTVVELDRGLETQLVTGTFEPQQTTREVLDILAAALGATVNQSEDGRLLLVAQ